MDLPAKKYGFYSQQAVDDGCGSSFYATPDGKDVEVTAIYSDPDGKAYLWSDKVCVGEVCEWLYQGKPDTNYDWISDF